MSAHLIALGSVSEHGGWPSNDGNLHGLPIEVFVKSNVWYSIPAFDRAGYAVPDSYDDLDAHRPHRRGRHDPLVPR